VKQINSFIDLVPHLSFTLARVWGPLWQLTSDH